MARTRADKEFKKKAKKKIMYADVSQNVFVKRKKKKKKNKNRGPRMNAQQLMEVLGLDEE